MIFKYLSQNVNTKYKIDMEAWSAHKTKVSQFFNISIMWDSIKAPLDIKSNIQLHIISEIYSADKLQFHNCAVMWA
jgi:hypothetical protein